MKTRLLSSLSVLAFFLTIGFLTRPAINALSPPDCSLGQVIRLHVLANGDSAGDQGIKLRVRDAIIQDYGPLFRTIDNRESAERVLRASLGRIHDTALRVIRDCGQSYGARVEYGSYDFPEREYSFATLPSGRYHALRVSLGSAAGANWWCVLYPPLCFVSDQDDALLREEVSRNGGKIEWHFGLLEKILQSKGLGLDSFWKSWAAFFGVK